MARTAWSNEIDCLIGGTSNEGLIMGLMNPTRNYDGALVLKNVNYFTPSLDLGLDPDGPKAAEYGKILKETYYGSSTPSTTNLEPYFNYIGDLYFWHGIQRIILSRAAASKIKKGKTYVYRFDVVTELNFLKRSSKNDEFSGSEHTADLFHLFKGTFAPLPSIDSIEFENIKKTVAIFTSFAINGNPSCPEIGDDEWVPNDSTDLPLKCLNIGTEACNFVELPETERLNVWNSIYQQAGVDLY